MYVTDVPVMDRLTDPSLRAAEELETLASELDMALYDPESADRPAAQVSDLLAEGVSDLLDTLHRNL